MKFNFVKKLLRCSITQLLIVLSRQYDIVELLCRSHQLLTRYLSCVFNHYLWSTGTQVMATLFRKTNGLWGHRIVCSQIDYIFDHKQLIALTDPYVSFVWYD